MNTLEKKVRDAHQALADAVAAARAGGYRIDWPDALAISETAAVKPQEVEDLSKLSRADLVVRAEAAGIDVKSDWNKSDLITALNG